MTPKEKAEDLVDKIHLELISKNSVNIIRKETVKNLSIIIVNEIINSSPSLPILSESGSLYNDIEESKSFWQEVKNQLLKQQNNESK